MRALIALFLLAVGSCAGVSELRSQPLPRCSEELIQRREACDWRAYDASQGLPACTAERVERLEPCDWRAFNARRRRTSLEGYYVSAGPDFVGDLIIVEGDDNTLVVSIDGYSPRTTHLCAGAFEGVAGEATLTPLAGEASDGSTCRASLSRTGGDEVFFGLTDYPCICGARAYVDGVYRLRRRD